MSDAQKKDNLPQVQILQSGDGARFYRDVPDYRSADPETRAAMDALIATVDYEDLNTIMAFGKEATDEVLAVSRQINERAAMDEGVLASMRAVGEELANLDTEGLVEKVMQLTKAGVDFTKKNSAEVATGVGVGLFAGPLFGLLAALGVKGARTGTELYSKGTQKLKGETDYAAQAEAVRDDLRKSILGIRSIVTKLQSADDKIPQYLEEVNQMGRVRGRAYSNLSLAIGAGNELVRRFQEDVLPSVSNDEFVHMDDLRQLQSASDAMQRRVEGLASSRAVSLQNVAMLANSQQMYVNMQMKIREHLTASVPEWEGQIAQGHMLIDQFDLQKSIDAADKKSGQLLENQHKLYEMSKEMNAKSMRQGTYNLEQVAHATEKMVLSLSRDMQNLGEYRQKNIESQQRVLAATEKLSQVFQESAQQRAKILLTAPRNEFTALAGAETAEAAPAQNPADKVKSLLHAKSGNDNNQPASEEPQHTASKTPGGPGGMN